METLTPEQQLQHIEQQIEHNPETGEVSPESVSKIVEGTIQQAVPEFQASSHGPRTMTDAMPDEEAAKVQAWVNLSFTKSIWDGVNAAKASGDPALIDAFHGALSGQLYDTLIERGKLKKVV